MAVIEVAVERGYTEFGVDEVVARAGIEREEFDRRFSDKDECARRCFEAFAIDWFDRCDRAYYARRGWRDGLRAAAYETSDWILGNPVLVQFGAVELLKAEDEMIRVRREEAFNFGAEMIDRGRAEAEDPDSIPAAAATMAVGSIVQLLTHKLQTSASVEPEDVVPHMLYLAVRPYVGEESAREELEAPRPS